VYSRPHTVGARDDGSSPYCTSGPGARRSRGARPPLRKATASIMSG